MLMAVGDIHLGALHVYVPKLWKKQLLHLKNIFDYAVKHDIGHVFLLGDIFDTPNPPDWLKIALRKLLFKYRDVLTIHAMIGNHDWESIENHALQILHDLGETKLFNFKVYTKPEIIKVEGVRLFVCSHPHIMDVPSKKIDWCLGHFAWNGAKGDNGFAVKSGNAPRGRWILGDFHPHQKGDRYVYCGSVSQVKWDESLPKGVILFDKDDWEFKPIEPTYQLGIAEVENDKQLEKLDSKILWSVRTINNYNIPANYKHDHPNIVHITAARRRKDIRAQVLLAKEDSVLRNPMRLLKSHLQASKADLSAKEVKYAMREAERIYTSVMR